MPSYLGELRKGFFIMCGFVEYNKKPVTAVNGYGLE